MSDQWYIQDNAETYGPYALSDLFELMEQQKISAEAWLTCGGMRVDQATLRSRWPDPRSSNGTPHPSLPPSDAGSPNPARPAAAPTSASPESQSQAPPQGEAPSKGAAPPPPAQEPPTGAIPPGAPSATGTAPPPHVTPAPAPPIAPLERDSILILGRRQAGKTIFLATLYSMLWKSAGGLTMKSLSGANHTSLMSVMDQLRKGIWPDATLGSRQIEFEIDDSGRKRLMVALDYAGEHFSEAFVAEDQSSANVRSLLTYLDRAMAVILLVDPTVAVRGNVTQIADDDFGMVQAVERVRNWPGGHQIPIVLALTKIDRTKHIVREAGDVNAFVMRHYPALVRTLKKVNAIPVSAVQQKRGADGKAIPAIESVPINVDKPLRFCLDQIRMSEAERERRDLEQSRERARQAQIEQSQAAVRSTNRAVVYAIAAFWIVGICVAALIFILRES